jgi:hypothetical protein
MQTGLCAGASRSASEAAAFGDGFFEQSTLLHEL